MARVLIAGLGKGMENKPRSKESTDGNEVKSGEFKEYDYKRENYKMMNLKHQK